MEVPRQTEEMQLAEPDWAFSLNFAGGEEVTQQLFIFQALAENNIADAKKFMSNWSHDIFTRQKQGRAQGDLANFQETLIFFLEASPESPTFISSTVEVTEMLADSGTKAQYLYRMLGGRLMDDEEAWTTVGRMDYWQPASSEIGWLARQREPLADHPVAEVIDRVVAEASARVLRSTAGHMAITAEQASPEE